MTSDQLNDSDSPDSITRAIAHGFLDLLNTETDGTVFWNRIQETREGFSESLFGELTTAEFVDYVRPQITRTVFKQIEAIAAEFLTMERREDYPKTVILLMNLARSHTTKVSKIYQSASIIYEHYKTLATRDAQSEASKLALEAGVQLYRHEKDPEREQHIWPYLQFEYEHHGSLIERRMQFYKTKDPCVLFERTVNRWLRMARKDSKNALKETDFHTFGALHPQLLDLPVPYDSSNCLRVVELLSQSKRKKEKEGEADLSLEVSQLNQEELAKNLRVLQWDIFTRDLITEQRDHKLSYRPSTKEHKIPGTPPNKFLTDLIVKSRTALREFVPLYAGILRARSGRKAEPAAMPPKINQYRKGFERVLNAAQKYSPFAYDNVIEFFSISQEQTVLVEDGELSFFSLLWLLRHAVNEGDDPQKWREYPESELLSVAFLPTDEIKANSWWQKMNLPDFAELCGLIIPGAGGQYILTRRWRSMLQWLQGQQTFGKQPKLDAQRPLPVKIFRSYTNDEKEFVRALADALASPELATFLSDVKVYPDKISIQQFAKEQIGPLIRIIDPLLHTSLDTSDSSVVDEPNEPWPKRDLVLFKLCRAAFLPVEFLFRVYQPYELHLLILALSFTRTDLLEKEAAPVALAFATIAGALPPGVSEGAARSKAPVRIDPKYDEITRKAHQWLVPYWTLFTALAAELSMGKLQESVMELWVTNILNAFSHEVGKHQAYIFNKLFLEMNHVFEIETVDKPTSDDVRLYLWPKPAGVIKAAEGAAELSKWRVCPVPDTLKSLYQLYSVWAGAKNQLSDFGIDANCTFKDLLEKIKPMAREMAVARNRVEQAPLIRSLKESHLIDEITRTRAFHNAKITEELVRDARKLQFAGGEDYEYRMRKIFLIRALLAALSNAVYHTSPSGVVRLTAKVSDNWVEIEILNPTLGKQKKGIDEFGIGSEAVMQTCARQLGGGARLFKQDDDKSYLSVIRFPITQTEELQWLKINED